MNCGCQKFCPHHGRDCITDEDNASGLCQRCTHDGAAGALVLPQPFSTCLNTTADTWARTFMCLGHAVDHQFVCDSEAQYA